MMSTMKKLLTTLVTLGGIALAGSPLASAAPDEDGFLDYMSHHGGTVNAFTRGFLLSGGNAACQDIGKGVPVDQVRVPYPGASDQALRDLATGASLFLCPAGGH